ncbi:hypothetical protein LTR56_014322 [Elasticomyces elasticus]|nr:hypothetical protein LTR56_014322 [Elasticomyces elasticus]KAK4916578.1 hypothetical protein LTR49_015411 [Elasticomyces elasticus]KAK5756185.1 hypothetical protein LTS12_013738 [Elasticomyces elasticus]
MPRSRLKSRLSPEQAQGITYPVSPPLPSPRLTSGDPYNNNERGPIVNGVRAVHAYAEHHIHGLHHHEDPHYPHHNHHRHQQDAVEQQDVGHCTCGDHEGEIPDSGDEEVEFDHPDYRYTTAAAGAGTPTPAGYPGHVHEMVAAREIAAMAGGNGKQPPPLDSVQRRLMEARLGGGNGGKVPPGSTASSSAGGDGYESFENTSNKKKRKIPLSGASSTLHQSSLSAEMASMGISGQTDGAADDVGVQQSPSYTSPGVAVGAGTGISGAGRGRYGRSGNVNAYRNGLRRPLTNGTVNMAGAGKLMNGDDTFESTTGGIISQAIKSAAEQGPLTPQKATNGKTLSPNQSLLHSATSSSNSNNTTPKTQFTFHVDSESATKMADHEAAAANAAGTAYAQAAYAATAPSMPGSYPTAPPLQQSSRGTNGQYPNTPANSGVNRSTQGTQTTPSLRSGGAPGTSSNANTNTNNPSQRLPPPPTNQQHPPAPSPAAKPKPRRRPSKEYALAARQRQLQQEYTNYHHRPTKDNLWICEFCEYEDIFGTPPLALIRSYEIKDRKERKAKEERRRLLEKAKMKGRKGKGKGGKKGGKDGGAPGPGTAPVNGAGGGGYDARLDGNVPREGTGQGEEEYYDDDEGGYGEGSLEGEGDEYEPEGGEGEYEDAYYAPPATAGPRGTAVQAGGGGLTMAGKQGGTVLEGGRA